MKQQQLSENQEKLSFYKDSNFETFKDYFESTDSWVVMRGGAGAGKSYAVADKFALETMYQDIEDGTALKFVVVRKTLPALKKTCWEVLEERFKFWGIRYKLNKQEAIAQVGNNSKIVYASMNNAVDFDKVRSMTNIDFIWIEEGDELARAAFDILKLRLRGGKGEYSQGVITFNPVSTTSWLYTYFYENDYGEALKLKYTVDDNIVWKEHKNKRLRENYKEYVKTLDELKQQNINLYNTYRLGKWGQLEGIIFDAWLTAQKPPTNYSRIYYGLDFGFTVDPAALVRIYDLGGIEFYFEEIIYKTGLTNDDISKEMKKLGINPNSEIYCDSAEPKSIESLKRQGWNVHPAIKGQGSVNAGIDFLKSKKCHIVAGSSNIKKESDQYCWKTDKDGKKLPEPVDFMNHALDAIRYAVFTKYDAPSQKPMFSAAGQYPKEKRISYNNYGF